MESSRPKVTIDTNCVINLFDRSSPSGTSIEELQTLFRYALSGRIELAVTTRLESDLLQDKDESRRAEMLRKLEMLPIVGTVARWDVSRWDSDDFWSDDRSERLANEIQGILSPGLTPADKRFSNKVNDIDHLVGHAWNRRDIFVTDDSGILRRVEELARAVGIVVKRPAECVAYVDAIVARAAPRALPTDGINSDYHSGDLQGTVSFNYSNNDHRYALGNGHWFFETRWSKASNTAIHALNDPPSISAIALATGAAAIPEITDATAFDFSSRDRTAEVGKIVIWRNTNGVYAATRIIDVTDDSRGDAADALTFEYVILAGGGTDFSEGT